jgi:hypothetical protein
MKEVELLA